MSLKEAKEKAQEIDKILRCTYPGFRGNAHVIHEDGTSLLYKNAFLVTYKGCVIVFSEHNGIYVNSTDDLMFYENVIDGKWDVPLDEEKIVLWNKRDEIYGKIFNKFIKKEFPTNNYGLSVREKDEENIFSTLIFNRQAAEHPHTQVTNQKGENMKKKWRYSVEFKENSTEIKEEKYAAL